MRITNTSPLTQREVELCLNERESELNKINGYLLQNGSFTQTESKTVMELIEADTELMRSLFSKLGYKV